MHFTKYKKKSKKQLNDWYKLLYRNSIYGLVSITTQTESESVLNFVDEMNFVTCWVVKCNEQKSLHM